MFEFNLVEGIGILATIFIIVAFSLNGEFKIRVLDLIGAILFVIYGFFIKSFSTMLLNGILIGIQVFKLIKLKNLNKEIKAIEIEVTNG